MVSARPLALANDAGLSWEDCEDHDLWTQYADATLRNIRKARQ